MSGYDPTGLMTMTATIDHTTMTGPPDEYGNPTPEVVTTTTRCWIAQSSRGESPFNTVEQDKWSLYLPSGADIDANDGVTVDGDHYQVFGNPWRTWHPAFGQHWQIEATMHRTV